MKKSSWNNLIEEFKNGVEYVGSTFELKNLKDFERVLGQINARNMSLDKMIDRTYSSGKTSIALTLSCGFLKQNSL